MSAIWSQEHFIVFGGDDGNNSVMKTEKCYFTNEDEVACVSQAPEVQFVEYSFSELFNVGKDFCLKY